MESQTLTLKIKDNSYTVNYPTVGQRIKIESLKQQLTDGQYGNMSSSLLQTQWDALEQVDIIANFSVLIPQLLRDTKVPIDQLAVEDFEDISQIYKDQFVPWYKAWNDLLKKRKDDAK